MEACGNPTLCNTPHAALLICEFHLLAPASAESWRPSARKIKLLLAANETPEHRLPSLGFDR